MFKDHQPIRKLALAVCLTLTAGVIMACPCRAQAPPNTQSASATGKNGNILDRRVNVNAEEASLASVLKTLMQSVGADYTLAPELRRVTVTAHLTNMPLGIALDTLLKASSPPAIYHVENGVFFFALRAETPTLPDNTRSEAMQPDADRGRIHTVRVNYIDAGDLARLLGGMAIKIDGQSYGLVNPNAPGGLFGPRTGGNAAPGQNGGNLAGSLFDGSLILIGNAGAGFP